MSVDPSSKKAMAQILSAINDDPFGLSAAGEGTINETHVAPRIPVLDQGGEAMKNILMKFNQSVESTVSNMVSDDLYPKVKEAMVTERTARGARIGSWEIIKNGDADFDVVHLDTHEPIAKGLKIYEAAYALVSGLNAGRTLTDASIRKILQLEEQYASHLGKATHFKHMAKKLTETGETSRAAIAEDRFDDARGKALDEREELLRLAGLR